MNRPGDIAWCAISAPILMPIFIGLAMAIRLDDGGSVFFHQARIGRGRRPFSILKFRTLSAGRTTRVGAWLRRTGLDETAQWFNVLRGDMSWIGPRPLTVVDVARLGWHEPEHDPRFELRPGVTGLAQLRAGTGPSWTRGLDRLYRRRCGPGLDAWIVCWSIIFCIIGKTRGRILLRGRGRDIAKEV